MTELSAKLEIIRNDLEQFIADKVIDEHKVSNYSEIVSEAHKQKLEWALSDTFEPLKSIQIYDAYKLLYDSISSGRTLLLEAKARGENPTTAERILPYFQNLTLFVKKLEAELNKEENSINFNRIENEVEDLRSEGISLRVLKTKEDINPTFYKKIQETAINSLDAKPYL